MADEVANGIDTRNLAAHGAFFWEDQTQGTLGAAHYFARGKGKARELFEVKQTVSRQAVEETIQVANMLLHDVIDLRAAVISSALPRRDARTHRFATSGRRQRVADANCIAIA